MLLKPLDEEPGTGGCSPSGSDIPRPRPSCSRSRASSATPDDARPARAGLETLDSYVERVEITRVDEGTFFAAIIRARRGAHLVVDARPRLDRAGDSRGRTDLRCRARSSTRRSRAGRERVRAGRGAELEAFRDFLDQSSRRTSAGAEPEASGRATRTAAPRSDRAARPSTPGTRRRRCRPPR